jgi:hypothetical protein
MAGGGKAAHVEPDLGEDYLGARALTPEIEINRSTAVRKGAMSASTCRSIAASRASICLRRRRSRSDGFW